MDKKPLIHSPALKWLSVLIAFAASVALCVWLGVPPDAFGALLPLAGIVYVGYLILKALKQKGNLSTQTLRAFLLAPLFPAVCATLAMQNAMMLLGSLVYAYLSIFLFAVPAYVWISKRRKVNIFYCLGAGLLIGAWPGCLVGYSNVLLITVSFGLSTALIFWIIGIKEWKKPK